MLVLFLFYGQIIFIHLGGLIMKFGERLKKARVDMNLTQIAVANELFITRQTISSWENEKTYPDISSLIKLSNYYHPGLFIKTDKNPLKQQVNTVSAGFALSPVG